MPRVDGARRRVAKLMTDTCSVTRQQDRYSAGSMNPETLEVTPDPVDTVYKGKCYIAPSGRQARTDDVAGNDASQRDYLISIPFDAPELRPGDLVTIDTSADLVLAGNKFEVRDLTVSTIYVWRQATMVGLETSRG